MARNWTAAEAFAVIQKGESKSARIDIGRRFPLFATSTPEEIISAIPAYVSARKIEAILKGDVETNDEGEDESIDVAPRKSAKKAAKPTKSAKKSKRHEVEEDEDDDLDDDDDDEDDDDDDDDEDEDEAPRRKSKKPVKKSKKPADDDELDDF